MSNGIRLQVTWFDDDVLKVSVTCCNGRFSGTAVCFSDRRAFKDMALAIRGFPASRADRREFTLGTFDPGFAGGGVRIRLGCVDASAHPVADVELRADPLDSGGAESAVLRIPVEAAGVDEFVAELQGAQIAIGASAHLRQAT